MQGVQVHSLVRGLGAKNTQNVVTNSIKTLKKWSTLKKKKIEVLWPVLSICSLEE